MDIRLSFPPEPRNAPALAQIAVEAAREISGFELDYTPLSLILVDEQVGRLSASDVGVEGVASTLFCLGCYVGEVLVKSLAGVWLPTEQTSLDGLAAWPMVVCTPNGSCWNPIGKVFKRFEDGESEGLRDFFHTAAEYARREKH